MQIPLCLLVIASGAQLPSPLGPCSAGRVCLGWGVGFGCCAVEDAVQPPSGTPTFRCLNMGGHTRLRVQAHVLINADFSVESSDSVFFVFT